MSRPAASHGGAGEAAIDLSASLNPLGPHPAAVEAARTCGLGRYPEPDARALVRAAAAHHRIDAACIVPVPGASWGLWLCAVALLGPGDRCLAIGPCFGENRRSVEIAGATFREVRDWPPDGASALRRLGSGLAARPAMAMAANPGNPGGQAVPGPGLRRLCEREPRTWFVIDEAFASFAPPDTSLLDGGPPPPNAVVVRSLTKELALPGLRMGYLVAKAELAAHLNGVLPAWPLSAPAVAAAAAGLADRGHVEAGAAVARRHVAELAAALEAVGAAVFASDANYLVARARGAAGALRGRGIAVRDCASFDLPDHVRLAAPRPRDMAVVLAALAGLDGRG
jgi:histidinol-phosphate/aromatic aminotransferase/cobyric acid decarboxylase-like protein